MAERELLSDDSQVEEIRKVQTQAWQCVRNGAPRPYIAIELLRSIRDPVDARPGSEEWAAQECLTAMAYAVLNDDVAADFSKGAAQRLAQVTTTDPRLVLDFHRGLGKFFFRKGKLVDARREYEAAERVAIEIDDEDEIADIHLKLFELANKETRDRIREQELMTFRRVAKRLGCPKPRQARKWRKHLNRIEQAFANVRFARDPAPRDERYFEDLLNSEDDEE